jgi:hypothetical protein
LVNWHPDVEDETLGEGYECVEEMGVGWGVWFWAPVGAHKVEGEKSPTCAWSRGFGKV